MATRLGAREVAIDLAGVVAEHGGASGVAFAWEMQLLAGRAGGVPDMSTPSAPICIGYRGPLLAVRPEGANHQRGRISPGQLSIGSEAGEWLGLREGDLCDALGSHYRSSSGGRFSHCEPAWLRPASKRAAM
jgi:hypothetical protein